MIRLYSTAVPQGNSQALICPYTPQSYPGSAVSTPAGISMLHAAYQTGVYRDSGNAADTASHTSSPFSEHTQYARLCLLRVYHQGEIEFGLYSKNGRSFSSSRMFVIPSLGVRRNRKRTSSVFFCLIFSSFCLVFRLSKSSL